MRLWRQRWFVFGLAGLLLGCSLWLVIARSGPSRHTEIREAFILLQTGGYTNEARVLYNYLLFNLHQLSNKRLIEDWQRTVMLVDPSANLPNNLIWRYHWTVRREMEKRAESSIQRARQLAAELQEKWGGLDKTNLPPAPPSKASPP